MDPITAFAMMVKAALEFATEMARGQSDAQREKVWSWVIADIERWRKLFKLDGA